jgi:uncharacterized protein (TIGR02453 family)
MAFLGFPAETFEFYENLTAQNTREFWAANRDRYEQHVRGPLLALAHQLEPAFGPAHLYRPHRDLRFRPEGGPLKDHQGMFVEDRHGVGWYLQVSADGLMCGGGWHAGPAEQVQRFRDAVDRDDRGALAGILDDIGAAGFSVEGDRLRTRPRGTPADHPRLDLLRHRSLVVVRRYPPGPVLTGGGAGELVARDWRTIRPLVAWLSAAVGPLPPKPRR